MKYFKFDIKIVSIVIGCILLVGAGYWLFTGVMEFEKPVIQLAENVERIGLQKSITISFSDSKTGLRSAAVWIEQAGNQFPVSSIEVPKGTKEKTVHLLVNAREMRLQDGEAILHIAAMDFSILKNREVMDLKVIVDSTPPQVFPLSSAHNINPGGTCLTLFRVSKEAARAGVMVGADFFPGYPAELGGKTTYMTYFPIPSDVSNSTRMSIYVEDKAGNQASSSLPFYIRSNKKFRSDSVNLSDVFLSKMTDFQQRDAALNGKTPLEIFTFVNTSLRQENDKTIQAICAKTQPRQLWSGLFLRMKNGAPMAMFGDQRTYMYAKQAVGNSVHLGQDLASNAHSPVEAANNGIVVFSGYLGIYGNAVMIDHGLGIMSLYGHMESINVKEGQQVAKGEQIGITGASGLAGGDHLHFSILVGQKFVNPIEWWDPHWLQDNVDKKLKEVS